KFRNVDSPFSMLFWFSLVSCAPVMACAAGGRTRWTRRARSCRDTVLAPTTAIVHLTAARDVLLRGDEGHQPRRATICAVRSAEAGDTDDGDVDRTRGDQQLR